MFTRTTQLSSVLPLPWQDTVCCCPRVTQNITPLTSMTCRRRVLPVSRCCFHAPMPPLLLVLLRCVAAGCWVDGTNALLASRAVGTQDCQNSRMPACSSGILLRPPDNTAICLLSSSFRTPCTHIVGMVYLGRPPAGKSPHQLMCAADESCTKMDISAGCREGCCKGVVACHCCCCQARCCSTFCSSVLLRTNQDFHNNPPAQESAV